MRILFLLLLSLHGIIHVLGFLKAFQISNVEQLTLPISKTWGILWGITFLLFVSATIFYAFKLPTWWIAALAAVLVSQVLIINFWQDAKFGTVANLIILLVTIVGYANWNFEKSFHKDVQIGLLRTDKIGDEIFVTKDLQHLPAPVQKYLNYVGVVGKPKVKNVSITFEGEMRGKNEDWFKFTSEQYNFMEEPTRLFFMKANVKRLPTNGYHVYQGESAGMYIKIFSLFPVVTQEGKDLFKAETVTFFNDLCLFAPAALIDERIRWEAIDDFSAKAFFTNRGVTISATLYFNKKGELTNFISDDRTDVSDMEAYRFSTPTFAYKNVNGFNLCSGGEAIWHYPDGEFVYGKLRLKQVEYNVDF